MIDYPASLKAVGGARGGVAPVNLLDVQDANGNSYFWSDRKGSYPNGLNLGPEVTVPGTAWPWDPTLSGNSAYPIANGGGIFVPHSGTAPVVIPVTPGQMLTISASGSVLYGAGVTAASPNGIAYGAGAFPGTSSGDGGVFPVQYIAGASANAPIKFVGLMGCWADADGNVIEPLAIGESVTLFVPQGVAQLQLGINDNVFGDNSGSFTVSYSTGIGDIRELSYQPWLLDVPQFSFHRSLLTDTGSFIVQNLSGDTLSRDTEKILRASTLEGALFVYRLWQADAEAAWLEVHGTLTVDPVGTRDLTLKGSSLINAAQDDTPLESYCETCQIDWAGRRCGSTQATECSYSLQSCQVVERIMVVLNHYEKNFGEAAANVTVDRQPNRRRRI